MNITDKNLFVDTARSVLDSVANVLANCGRDPVDCQFVGFDRPAENHCPDLVAWVSNVRPYDGNALNSGLVEGRFKCNYALAFDITVRLGRCYIEMDDKGNLIDAIEDWSNELYRDGYVMYVQWIGLWKSGGVTEIDPTDPVEISALIPFKEGGCAGWEFTITVGVV